MNLQLEQIDSLPRLSWCVEVSATREGIRVQHGSAVETTSESFVEGAWSESFADNHFDRSRIMMGSGGKLDEGCLLLCSPTHTAERLHLIRVGSRLVVSNSLTFCLECAGLSLDPAYIPYHCDLISVVGGLENHVRSIPTTGPAPVELYYHTNLRVRPDLSVEPEPKASPQEFPDYETYRRFLVEGLSGLNKNANAPERHTKYPMLTTVSSGYDSAACAALATDVGCSEAITIRDSRHGFAEDDDSGIQVGDVLGLEVREVQRSEYLKRPNFPEAEFVACGDLGQDVVFASFEPYLAGRMVLTGFHGGKVWDRNCKVVSHSIVRGDPSGNSMTEFRLRLGFIHVALPFMGCLQQPSIYRIGNSEEMSAWQIGGDYDRPIPRRIVESKGVVREMFGMRKKAVTVLLNSTTQDLRTKMKKESVASLESCLPAWRARRALVDSMIFAGAYRLNRLWLFAQRVLRKVGVDLRTNPLPARYRQNPDVPSFLIHWGISHIRHRYETHAPSDE